jgi:hypothetical protein
VCCARNGLQFNGATYEAVVRVGAALRALMYNTELVAGLMQTWTPNSPDRQLHIGSSLAGGGDVASQDAG